MLAVNWPTNMILWTHRFDFDNCFAVVLCCSCCIVGLVVVDALKSCHCCRSASYWSMASVGLVVVSFGAVAVAQSVSCMFLVGSALVADTWSPVD